MALGDAPPMNVIGAFQNAQNFQEQQQGGALQKLAVLQGILSARQQQQQRDIAMQRDTQMRGALSALPPTASSEDVMAAVRPFASADELMRSGDRRLTADSNKEMALARLQQARAMGEQVFALKAQNAKTAAERAQVDAGYKAFQANIAKERLKYDTGADVAPFAPLPQGPALPPAAVSGTSDSLPAAIGAINANVAAGGPGGTLQAPAGNPGALAAPAQAPAAPSPVPAPPGGNPWALSGPTGTMPAAVPVPPPADAQNLDARDLLARSINAPAEIPNATPGPLPAAPVAAQAASPVEGAVRAMPASVAALPKKMQDKWLADNAGGGIEQTAKGIANYEIAPLSSFAMARPLGAQIMGRVKELNPEYDSRQYNSSNAAEKAFTSGRQGDQVRSFNVAINHLGTLKDLTGALQNGDIKQVNRFAQAYAEQTGESAPTNFDAAKKIVGDEISKAIIGSKGSLGDREATAAAISRANSPQQLTGVINTFLNLMNGQLGGLRKQYEAGTRKTDFNDRFLTPAAAGVAKAIPEFATEAEAVKAGVKGRVKIGGVLGTLN